MKWERRTEIIGGVPITSFEPVPVHDGPVDWSGGCVPSAANPAASWLGNVSQSDPAWVTTTIDDGADLFFPGLRGR